MAVLDTAELVLRANRYSGSGDWLDESGNGHHATPVGSPSWDGEKFTLDGATQYFTIPDDPALDVGVGEDLTVVAVATVAADVAADGRIVSKRHLGAGGWEFYYVHGTDRFGIYLSDGTNNIGPSVGVAEQGTRQMLSYRVDRASDFLRFGVDGTYTNSGSIAAIGDASVVEGVTIGRLPASASNYLKGDIYGVAIFTSALSDQDIEQAGQELTAVPSAPSNRMGGTGAIRRKGGPRP